MSDETSKEMTFGELKEALGKLTPEQLAQRAVWSGTWRDGVIRAVEVLREDHLDLGKGMKPASSLRAFDSEVVPDRVWPKGTTMLVVD